MRQSSILSVGLLLVAALALSDCQEEDPCAGIHCSYSAECEVDNGRARCVCPSVCPESEDPVCGTDGRTYNNLCKLDVYNCKHQTSVQQQYRGRCENNEQETDVCAGVRCAYGTSCEVDNGQPNCVCSTNCATVEDPVCGTDGKTYMNFCEMEVSNCKNQDNVRQQHRGRCQD